MPSIKIKSCSECPDQTEKRVFTGDSFENVFDWLCAPPGKKPRKIGQTETFDPDPKIPSWCPRKPKKKKGK